MRIPRTALTFVLGLLASATLAQDAKTVEKLAFGESDEKVEAVAALVAAGDEKSTALLQALADGELYTAGKRVLIVRGEQAVDAATGAKVAPLPEDREEITVNNRLRRELGRALAALKLGSPERDAPRRGSWRAEPSRRCCHGGRRRWRSKPAAPSNPCSVSSPQRSS